MARRETLSCREKAARRLAAHMYLVTVAIKVAVVEDIRRATMRDLRVGGFRAASSRRRAGRAIQRAWRDYVRRLEARGRAAVEAATRRAAAAARIQALARGSTTRRRVVEACDELDRTLERRLVALWNDRGASLMERAATWRRLFGSRGSDGEVRAVLRIARARAYYLALANADHRPAAADVVAAERNFVYQRLKAGLVAHRDQHYAAFGLTGGKRRKRRLAAALFASVDVAAPSAAVLAAALDGNDDDTIRKRRSTAPSFLRTSSSKAPSFVVAIPPPGDRISPRSSLGLFDAKTPLALSLSLDLGDRRRPCMRLATL